MGMGQRQKATRGRRWVGALACEGQPYGVPNMMDIYFLAITAAFGVFTWGLVVLCHKVAGGDR